MPQLRTRLHHLLHDNAGGKTTDTDQGKALGQVPEATTQCFRGLVQLVGLGPHVLESAFSLGGLCGDLDSYLVSCCHLPCLHPFLLYRSLPCTE